ncbi:heptaprenyl diphosphate synthase [bacterium]|nr:MAG: heptaprenyl diphosphate synthase [bacterium]
MQSQDRNKRVAVLAILIALGAVLWALEEFIPRPIPWLKPGLANIATVIAIVVLGPWDGLPVAIGRVILGALILGRIGSAAFLMSISGAVVSAAVMGVLWRIKAPLSIYGISVSGALAHGLSQLGVAVLLVYTPFVLRFFLPLVSLPAIATGLLVGLLSVALIKRFPGNFIYGN